MSSRMPLPFSKKKDVTGLPEPVTTSPAKKAGSSKRATFDDDGLPNAVRVHWSRFKKRLGNGSNVSESLLEITESNAGSDFGKKGFGMSDGPSPGAQMEDDTGTDGRFDEEEVNEVVVENHFLADGGRSVTQQSDHNGTPDKSGTSATHQNFTDGESNPDIHGQSRGPTCIWAFVTVFNAFRYRARSVLERFFFTSFYDPNAEAQYKRETYYQMKGLNLAGSVVLLLNWILICILINRSTMVVADKIFYWALSPVLLVPLPIMIVYDWPKDHPWIYQIIMSIAVWSYCAYSLLLVQLCGYYNAPQAVFTCPGKDFIAIFYYTSSFPVIALFALGQNRLMATIIAVLNASLIGIVVKDKSTWIRHLLNYVILMVFILWIHYQREVSERRLYTMRDRLKVQYRATQKAQVRESKAADSKKRFSSYIFHEVRVPLNTALLAVQNMEACGMFDKDKENIEYIALEGSLNMMSKVLNDVLDFNRMDSGRFESVSKPYAFHNVMKGMLVPLEMAAKARGLDVITELDPQIDIVARTALYEAKGDSPEVITKRLMISGLDGEGDEAGLVVGDEHRLRQIITNLASNACKFTPAGGTIHVRTKLLVAGFGAVDSVAREDLATPCGRPSSVSTPRTEGEEDSGTVNTGAVVDREKEKAGLTGTRLRLHNKDDASPSRPTERIVIRIEVEDTGVGIRRKDMIDNRLFSPYVQTDLGRFQGGKGTGLGLALSKHIVRLSGGRLGVKSKRNHGSMFWVELSMGVGNKVTALSELAGKDYMVAETFALSRATTEAFKAPDNEGFTPSTFQSSVDPSPKESGFPTQAQAQQSSQAMAQLMEHSGQIELLPRMAHRLTDTSGRSATELINAAEAASGGSSSIPPSPQFSKSGKGPLPSGLTMTPSAVQQHQRQNRPTSIILPPSSFSGLSKYASISTVVPEPIDPVKSIKISSQPTLPTGIVHRSDMPSVPLFSPPLEVLVVDDDNLTRKLMSRMLTRIGCNVETADNGKTALDMAMRAPNPFVFVPLSPQDEQPARKIQTPYPHENDPRYHVIFLDNQMPVLSGVEMVKKLRHLQRKDFVVGVTGNALKEDQQDYLDAGVDAVLTKPVAEASLRNCLMAADERRTALTHEREQELLEKPMEDAPLSGHSAYNMYMRQKLAEAKEKHPDLTHKECFRLIAEEWKNAPENPNRK